MSALPISVETAANVGIGVSEEPTPEREPEEKASNDNIMLDEPSTDGKGNDMEAAEVAPKVPTRVKEVRLDQNRKVSAILT
jgi:hypothetical protein